MVHIRGLPWRSAPLNGTKSALDKGTPRWQNAPFPGTFVGAELSND
jgi:hypothetical protein